MYPKITRFKDFSNYSSYDQYLTTGGDNWSDIMDAIIRYTAKYTDSYAGDGYYLLSLLEKKMDALKSGRTMEPYEIYISFREGGVNWFDKDGEDYDNTVNDSTSRALYRFKAWYGQNDYGSNELRAELNRVRYHMPEYLYYEVWFREEDDRGKPYDDEGAIYRDCSFYIKTKLCVQTQEEIEKEVQRLIPKGGLFHSKANNSLVSGGPYEAGMHMISYNEVSAHTFFEMTGKQPSEIYV